MHYYIQNDTGVIFNLIEKNKFTHDPIIDDEFSSQSYNKNR